MKFWKCEKPFVLEIVAANSAEEAIETIIEFRNQEYNYGLMDEEDKEYERNSWTSVTEMIMPEKPMLMASFRE